jgi:hypothetical protein
MWGHMQRDKDSTTEMTPQHLEQAWHPRQTQEKR